MPSHPRGLLQLLDANNIDLGCRLIAKLRAMKDDQSSLLNCHTYQSVPWTAASLLKVLDCDALRTAAGKIMTDLTSDRLQMYRASRAEESTSNASVASGLKLRVSRAGI